MQTALTIAGSDSGGGAGIQADLRTFQALGVYGTCAITAVTAQNTLGVRAVQAIDAAIVAAQIDAVAEDFSIAATKIGMLANADIIRVVAAALGRHHLGPIVLDPVMVAKGGAKLLDEQASEALVALIRGRATLITPNLAEAQVLTGLEIANERQMRAALAPLLAMGAQAVLLKGGHLDGSDVVDIFSDGRTTREWRAAKIETRHTHGTGCTLASAIAAGIAQGLDMIAAIERARLYVRRAIETAPGFGQGHGPLNHGHPFKGSDID